MANALDPERCYFGGRLRAQTTGHGLTLSEVEYDEARRCPAHTHGRAFYSLLLRGGYVECFRTFQLGLQPFDAAFHPEGVAHADEVTVPRTAFFLMEFDRELLMSLNTPATRVSAPHVCAKDATPSALRLLHALRSHPRRDDLDAECAVFELLGSLTRAGDRVDGRRPRWAAGIEEFIHEEASGPLTLRSVARTFGLHPVYLSRAFRRVFGMGLPQAVRRVRIQSAISALPNDGLSLADVAALAGFSDQSQMTKVLHAATGMTPAKLRELSGARRRSNRRRTSLPRKSPSRRLPSPP